MAWCLSYVAVSTGLETVSVNRENPGDSVLGGKVASILDFAWTWIVMEQYEMLMIFAIVICCCLVQVGPYIFMTECVTIRNPFGRVAIGAVTAREEKFFDAK